MNCQEFWDTMPELAEPANVQRHVDQCAECAARLAGQRRLTAGLREVAGQMSRVMAPARVESRLLAAFRLRNGMPEFARPVAREGSLPWQRGAPILTWATAAAAVIALALVLQQVRRPEPARQPVSRGAEMAFTGTPADIEPGGDAPGGDAPDGDALDGDALDEHALDGHALADESGFTPLPNAAQIGPNEDINLVRVEVPRSVMMALGYDVKAERASDAVQADVMLGSDGLARAVRFLD